MNPTHAETTPTHAELLEFWKEVREDRETLAETKERVKREAKVMGLLTDAVGDDGNFQSGYADQLWDIFTGTTTEEEYRGCPEPLITPKEFWEMDWRERTLRFSRWMRMTFANITDACGMPVSSPYFEPDSITDACRMPVEDLLASHD